MNGFEAFARGEAARAQNSPVKVFDWIKAAEIIYKNPNLDYTAGLEEDWFWTGGSIWWNKCFQKKQ